MKVMLVKLVFGENLKEMQKSTFQRHDNHMFLLTYLFDTTSYPRGISIFTQVGLLTHVTFLHVRLIELSNPIVLPKSHLGRYWSGLVEVNLDPIFWVFSMTARAILEGGHVKWEDWVRRKAKHLPDFHEPVVLFFAKFFIASDIDPTGKNYDHMDLMACNNFPIFLPIQ